MCLIIQNHGKSFEYNFLNIALYMWMMLVYLHSRSSLDASKVCENSLIKHMNTPIMRMIRKKHCKGYNMNMI